METEKERVDIEDEEILSKNNFTKKEPEEARDQENLSGREGERQIESRKSRREEQMLTSKLKRSLENGRFQDKLPSGGMGKGLSNSGILKASDVKKTQKRQLKRTVPPDCIFPELDVITIPDHETPMRNNEETGGNDVFP